MKNDREEGIWSSVMKMVFGTDERVRLDSERDQGARLMAAAERNVARLQQALDQRPAVNIDEAMRQIAHQPRD